MIMGGRVSHLNFHFPRSLNKTWRIIPPRTCRIRGLFWPMVIVGKLSPKGYSRAILDPFQINELFMAFVNGRVILTTGSSPGMFPKVSLRFPNLT